MIMSCFGNLKIFVGRKRAGFSKLSHLSSALHAEILLVFCFFLRFFNNIKSFTSRIGQQSSEWRVELNIAILMGRSTLNCFLFLLLLPLHTQLRDLFFFDVDIQVVDWLAGRYVVSRDIGQEVDQKLPETTSSRIEQN